MVEFQQNLLQVCSSYTAYKEMLVGPIFNETVSLDNAGRMSHIFGPSYEILLLH